VGALTAQRSIHHAADTKITCPCFSSASSSTGRSAVVQLIYCARMNCSQPHVSRELSHREEALDVRRQTTLKGRHLRQNQSSEDAAIEGLFEAQEQVGCHSELCDVNGSHSNPLCSIYAKGYRERIQSHLPAWQVVTCRSCMCQPSGHQDKPTCDLTCKRQCYADQANWHQGLESFFPNGMYAAETRAQTAPPRLAFRALTLSQQSLKHPQTAFRDTDAILQLEQNILCLSPLTTLL